MKKLLFAGAAVLLLATAACTDNQSAKSWGGTAEVTLPEGQKLVTATWKETNLWFLYRPARDGEVAEEYRFKEDSSWGVLEGTIIIKENIQ